jgi:drug/metabolite transporter (DMT)-like permease
MLLTAGIGACIAVVIGVFHPAVFALSARSVMLLLLAGVLNFAYIFPYIYALMQDEASRVVPLFQVAPIFSYLLGWILLHERLTDKQLIAGVVIVIAAIAMNLDLDNRLRFKKSVFWLMVLAAALFATEGFLFKYGTTDHSFWTGAFYQYAGLALTGLAVATVSRKFRENFWLVFRANKQTILTLSLLNEAISIGAFMLYNYAVLLAPLALVALVSNTQPFFVIAFGIILTIYFPQLGKETIARRHLVQKIVCTAVIFTGTYLLLR